MPTPIEEIRAGHEPLAMADLTARHRPLVIRGLVADWPIVQAALSSDTDFATALAAMDNGTVVNALLVPPEADGVVGYDASQENFNYGHGRISITQGLQRLAAYSRHAGPVPGLALQSAPVAECLPGFRPSHALALIDAAVEPRIWIGNKVTTPVHFDESHNVACVVCGARRFTLFAPDQVRNLYIGPLDFAPTGAAMGMARLDRPDDPRYPRLKDALAVAHVADLGPGDAIYMPPLWWHHVESLERLNALVNYWWRPPAPGGAAQPTALPALYHCILALKSLPEAERKAWRGLLDYYVFGDDDPTAHIPPSRHGVLGPLTPETAEKLRDIIRRHL